MQTLSEALTKLYERDLNKLEEEIKLYTDVASVWSIKGDIKNSAGNLCLHLCGNLQHFVGMILGGSDYKRNREYEFAAKDLPIEKLLAEIQLTKKAVLSTLAKLENGDLEKTYPQEVFGYTMTTMFFLVHLAGHLNYHLGQINYHRRLLFPGESQILS